MSIFDCNVFWDVYGMDDSSVYFFVLLCTKNLIFSKRFWLFWIKTPLWIMWRSAKSYRYQEQLHTSSLQPKKTWFMRLLPQCLKKILISFPLLPRTLVFLHKKNYMSRLFLWLIKCIAIILCTLLLILKRTKLLLMPMKNNIILFMSYLKIYKKNERFILT